MMPRLARDDSESSPKRGTTPAVTPHLGRSVRSVSSSGKKSHESLLTDARALIAQHCLAYRISWPPPHYVDTAVEAVREGDLGAIADLMWAWYCELRDRPG